MLGSIMHSLSNGMTYDGGAHEPNTETGVMITVDTNPKIGTPRASKRKRADKNKLHLQEDLAARLPLATRTSCRRSSGQEASRAVGVGVSEHPRLPRHLPSRWQAGDGEDRVGEVKLEDVRKRVVTYRGQANDGVAPAV
jgi:hypothetical protein